MLQRILFLLTISLTINHAFSQGDSHNDELTFSIKADIRNEQDEFVEVGNVMILSPIDSTLIVGDVFFDGQLALEKIESKEFLLKISALGYEDYLESFIHFGFEESLDIGRIQLKAQWMEGVEIIGRSALFEQKGSDLTVNVANTALSNAGTAMDIIRSSPKVLVNQDGQISVLGKGNALIYLDGQLIASNQILSELSSSDIKEIEIITNPSAKYDASGNAVINIVTKGRALEGYKIGLVQELGKGKFYRGTAEANAYYKVGKVMVQGSYSYRPWTFGNQFRQTRWLLNDDQESITDNHYLLKHAFQGNTFTFKSVYDVNSKSVAGIQYTGTFRGADKTGDNFRTAKFSDAPDFSIDTDVTGRSNQTSNTVKAFYEYQLDTMGSKISVNGQYSAFGFVNNENIDQLFTDDLGSSIITRRSRNGNQIGITSIQLDVQKYISKNSSVEMGLKNAMVGNGNTVEFEDLSENNWNLLPEFSNIYNYREQISAGYFMFKRKGKVNITAGLRAEYTHTQGDNGNEVEGVIVDRNYLNFFPSFNINKAYSENLNVGLNYSRRINRPVFQDLNPYILYVDSLVSLRGNPTLLPEYSQNVSASINYKSLNIDLNFTHTEDKINQLFRSLDPENPNVIAFVKENLNYTRLYSVSASHPFKYKSFSGFLTVGGFYDQHNIDDVNQALANNKPGYFLSGNSTFVLPYDVRFDVFFNYTSSRVDGVYIDNPISMVNCTLSKSLLNKRLKLILHANDIFDRNKFTGVTTFNNMSGSYLSEGDWHYFKVGLRWNFGKLGTGKLSKVNLSRDEISRINNS